MQRPLACILPTPWNTRRFASSLYIDPLVFYTHHVLLTCNGLKHIS